jgi:hypothetical protein
MDTIQELILRKKGIFYQNIWVLLPFDGLSPKQKWSIMI